MIYYVYNLMTYASIFAKRNKVFVNYGKCQN